MSLSVSLSLSVSHTSPVGLPCEGRDKDFGDGKDVQEVDEVLAHAHILSVCLSLCLSH
jgi:hypothetical protein